MLMKSLESLGCESFSEKNTTIADKFSLLPFATSLYQKTVVWIGFNFWEIFGSKIYPNLWLPWSFLRLHKTMLLIEEMIKNYILIRQCLKTYKEYVFLFCVILKCFSLTFIFFAIYFIIKLQIFLVYLDLLVKYFRREYR